MKARTASGSYDMYFRANLLRTPKKAAARKHAHKAHAHTKRVAGSRIFNMPDEQMSEPPVVPKDERHYWH